MDTNLLREKLLTFAKENTLVVVLGFVGLIFLSYGLISLLSSSSSSQDITFEPADALVKGAEDSSANKIVVDVEGAVVKPGVYSLASTSRIQDALIASGGLSQRANREWVTKNINLAAKLTDGAKIYVPLEGESGTGTSGTIGGGGASGSININTANESQLDTLSGVGPVTAQKIIAGRPYNSLEDLVTKKIISSSVFGKIKDKISIY